MNPQAIIAALNLESADTDTVRACVLEALRAYGQATAQPALVDAAEAAMPKAHPWLPPAEWRRFYEDHFRIIADPECSVCPDEADRYCAEYWQCLTDAERQARLADPSLGEQDGEKDADNLNDA